MAQAGGCDAGCWGGSWGERLPGRSSHHHMVRVTGGTIGPAVVPIAPSMPALQLADAEPAAAV